MCNMLFNYEKCLLVKKCSVFWFRSASCALEHLYSTFVYPACMRCNPDPVVLVHQLTQNKVKVLHMTFSEFRDITHWCPARMPRLVWCGPVLWSRESRSSTRESGKAQAILDCITQNNGSLLP